MQLDQVTLRRLEEIAAALAAECDGVFTRETVDRLANDSLRASAPTRGLLAKPRTVVPFVCAHDAGRSQPAVALARHVSQGRIEALSAGSDPAGAIDGTSFDAVAELAFAFPKPLTDEVVQAADVVATMGCGDPCPALPRPRQLDWPIADPAGQYVCGVRRIRLDILDLLKDPL